MGSNEYYHQNESKEERKPERLNRSHNVQALINRMTCSLMCFVLSCAGKVGPPLDMRISAAPSTIIGYTAVDIRHPPHFLPVYTKALSTRSNFSCE